MPRKRKAQPDNVNIEELQDASALDCLELLIASLEAIAREESTKLLRRRLSRLPAQQRQVLEWSFGFSEDGVLSLRAIGARLGVSHVYALRLREQGLARLRKVYGVSEDGDATAAA